jgi:ketosteroid isomerase-like protein
VSAGDVVSAYFAAINAEDWDALGALWEPGAELVATGARPRRGVQEVVAYFPRVLAAYPVHVDTPGRRIAEGSAVVVEVAFTGRMADGREIAFDAVDVFDLSPDGARIRRLSTWYDTAAVRRQMSG